MLKWIQKQREALARDRAARQRKEGFQWASGILVMRGKGGIGEIMGHAAFSADDFDLGAIDAIEAFERHIAEAKCPLQDALREERARSTQVVNEFTNVFRDAGIITPAEAVKGTCCGI